MKNLVLKTIIYLLLLIFLFSASCLDSISWVPAIICVVSLGLLLLFLLVNLEWIAMYEDSKDEK